MNMLDKVTVFCVVCAKEVPLERKIRRAVTCSPECATIRGNWLRERKELKKCKYCAAPSTVEERDDFRRWRRERGQTNTGGKLKQKAEVKDANQSV